MRYPQSPSEDLKSAIRRFESGLFEQAGVQLLAILQKNPSDADALYFLRLVERRLARDQAIPKPTLIWQFNPAQSWEHDWLHTLLDGCYGEEIVDNTWSKTARTMIVVDNRLVPGKLDYYRRAFDAGCRIILVHLSDEAFKDDLGAYRYCDGVVRNYYSELLADDTHVHFIPLGCKAGFCRDGATKPAAVRKYLWSFAGDAKKITRAEMLKAMEPLGKGSTHLTEGFGSKDALSTDDYRVLMDESVFAPCPGGWSNLETFRVYEALEAGAIPIVEKRPGFDYYTALLGAHPMPSFFTWAEAAAFVADVRDVERLRGACMEWWRALKPGLASDTAHFVEKSLRGPYAASPA